MHEHDRVALAEVDHVHETVPHRHPALMLAPVDLQPGGAAHWTVRLLAIGSGQSRHAAHQSIIYLGMRIAIDIDSTLHHYWDVLSEISRRRFGIELPYEEQFTWGITRLREDQLALCIEESHSDELILAAEPYPGAVETVRQWSVQGHFIHITSHRSAGCAQATGRWL